MFMIKYRLAPYMKYMEHFCIQFYSGTNLTSITRAMYYACLGFGVGFLYQNQKLDIVTPNG